MGSFLETYNDPMKVKVLILRRLLITVESLSRNGFEPWTSTGSKIFSSFIML